jgi:hypothetical protein
MFQFEKVPVEDLKKKSEERNGQSLLKAGEGSFLVRTYDEVISKNSGLPQIRISLDIIDQGGAKKSFLDYFPSSSNMSWKFYQFFCAIGHPEFYEKEYLEADNFINQMGRLMIEVKKDDREDRLVNRIKYYIAAETNEKDDVPW